MFYSLASDVSSRLPGNSSAADSGASLRQSVEIITRLCDDLERLEERAVNAERASATAAWRADAAEAALRAAECALCRCERHARASLALLPSAVVAGPKGSSESDSGISLTVSAGDRIELLSRQLEAMQIVLQQLPQLKCVS